MTVMAARMSLACSLDRACEPPALARPLPGGLVVTLRAGRRRTRGRCRGGRRGGVPLGQVEQAPLKCRRPGSVPPLARLADVSKVTGFHDGPAACRLSAQR